MINQQDLLLVPFSDQSPNLIIKRIGRVKKERLKEIIKIFNKIIES